MKFLITDENKNKFIKQRVKRNHIYNTLKWLMLFLGLLLLVLFSGLRLNKYGIQNLEYELVIVYVCICLLITCYSVINNIMINKMRKGISELFYEKMEVDKDKIHQEYSLKKCNGPFPMAGGCDRYLIDINANTIQNITINTREKQIEIISTNKKKYYADFGNKENVVDDIITEKRVFYDYYEPSLIDSLVEFGYVD